MWKATFYLGSIAFAIFQCLPSYATVKTECIFKKFKVVPDVFDVAPNTTLWVFYDGIMVHLSSVMTPRQVKDIPDEVDFQSFSHDDEYYTLCMTDPDAPSAENHTLREWHHWLVVNIPGNQVEKGETLSEYIGAGPPLGTGLHRYVYVAYKQPGKLTFDERRLDNRSDEGRSGFSIRNFANKYKMGNPVASVFFRAEWDDYVPTLYELIKKN